MVAVLRGSAFFCACMYLIFSTLAFYYGEISYRTAAVVVGVAVFAIMLSVSRERRGLSFFGIVLLFFCLFVFSLFNYDWSEYRSVFTVFVFVSGLGVAWYAVEFRKTWVFFELPFFVFLVVTLWLILIEGYGAAEFNRVLSGSSRNVYSGILLALASGYIFSREYAGKSISVTLFFLVFLISIPLYSRNGIFVSFVLLLCVLWRRSILAVSVMAIVSVVVLAFGWEYFYALLQSRTNLAAGLESDRYYIAQDYFAHLDLTGFLAGVDLTSVPMVEAFGGNPHSAFLRLHSFFGVSIFFFVFIFVISLIRLMLDRQYLLMIVLLLYLFRAAFDIFYLFNLMDFLVFPLVFYWYFKRFIPYFRREVILPPSRGETDSSVVART
ncbi:hypothetical protein FHJ31_23585 [Pseudomonas sp. Fig-3]|uniref:hypothetical protein n=1 Tax=unclassified Pseudomonas TaxID=196821 RepID=UPI0011119736|nr:MULTISPECIES: hypothetical protein [unclassified Pseudomonas]TNB79522.1 hypothetical protein FHJ31_23585 [Pseudomonas sp. Fig-3]